MSEIPVPIKTFLQELKKTERNPDKRRNFHVFYLIKHDALPDLYPLNFSILKGGLNTWNLIYRLWEAGQFVPPSNRP